MEGQAPICLAVGDRVRRVSERTASLILWLAEHDEKVSEADNVTVTFHCAGPSLKASLNVYENLRLFSSN